MKKNPVPVEFIEKKNNRKKIKEGREKWILDMHKAGRDVDWKEIDRQNRKQNTEQVIQLRQLLLDNQNFEDIIDNYEIILNREIEGLWIERGSNNLAGRIRTADIDFNNNVIYIKSIYIHFYTIIICNFVSMAAPSFFCNCLGVQRRL